MKRNPSLFIYHYLKTLQVVKHPNTAVHYMTMLKVKGVTVDIQL